MEISYIHQIKVPGIPTPTNTEQPSTIRPPTVVNVHHLGNKARYILFFTRKNVIIINIVIISLRTGGQFGVYVWGGNSFCLKYCFFAVATFTFYHQCIHMERAREERDREIWDGIGRGTVVVLGEIVYPSALVGGFAIGSKSRFSPSWVINM